MKTLLFGSLMGLFGAGAVFLSVYLGWPGWVLFIAWICFYLFGKSVKKSLNVYFQIALGIGLGILIELFGIYLAQVIGEAGLYVSIFLLIGSLAFLTKINGLDELAAWFFGLVVFFGAEPHIAFAPIARSLLLPLAAGFVLGYALDTIATKLVFRTVSSHKTEEALH